MAIKNRSDADTWQQEHDGRAPKKGELAPDFTLSNIQGKTSLTLSDFRGLKPVALVFGSFT
ncbi:MAG: hypothetical protein ACI906_002936 [Candidatus Latescibacterota bacterium]